MVRTQVVNFVAKLWDLLPKRMKLQQFLYYMLYIYLMKI